MIVILMGASGAGKTTVGRALAAATGWPFYDADDLHPAANVDKIRQGTPLTDADRTPWLAQERGDRLFCAAGVVSAGARGTRAGRAVGVPSRVAGTALSAIEGSQRPLRGTGNPPRPARNARRTIGRPGDRGRQTGERAGRRDLRRLGVAVSPDEKASGPRLQAPGLVEAPGHRDQVSAVLNRTLARSGRSTASRARRQGRARRSNTAARSSSKNTSRSRRQATG